MGVVSIDPIRKAAAAMSEVLSRVEEDPSNDPGAVGEALSCLVGPHEPWFDHALQRPTQLKKSRLIYFDPTLNFILSNVGTDFREPPHNHWAWNILLICTGSMHFRWYRRLDDGSEPGHCRLELAEDRILRPGDAGIVGAAPHDIHSFEILDDDTWMVTVSPDLGRPVRQFYDADAGTYVEREFWSTPEQRAASAVSS
jgi:predicted metal-dependent enzyme (double-stranded beta helix superfamily)